MFKNIKYLLLGLHTVFKHIFKKSVTLEYPECKKDQFKNFRGKPIANGNCIGCKSCLKVCPTGAIKLTNSDSDKINEICFDLKKCIFCGNCAYYCPKSVIKMSEEYELAVSDSKNLSLLYKVNTGDES